MSLSFTPKSENELFDLLVDGVYPFKVVDAAPHTSQTTGNQSIKLVLDVKGHEIKVYLSVNYLFLLKHFCDTVGLEDAYKQGKLSAELCKNKSGLCKVIIEEPAPGTNFFPKNVVKDFVKSDGEAVSGKVAVDKKTVPDEFDNMDDLPF